MRTSTSTQTARSGSLLFTTTSTETGLNGGGFEKRPHEKKSRKEYAEGYYVDWGVVGYWWLLVLLALILAIVAFGLGTWLVRNEVASGSDGGECAGGCANGTVGTNGTSGTNGTNGANGTNGTDGANGTCVCPPSAQYYYATNVTGTNSFILGKVSIHMDIPVPGDYYVMFDGIMTTGDPSLTTFQIASPLGNFTADSYRAYTGIPGPGGQVYVPTLITTTAVNQTVYVWWVGGNNAFLMLQRSLRAIRVKLP